MVKVIFTSGDSFVDNTIENITRGDYSHVAIQILGGTVESLGIPDDGDKYPGVHLHNLHKYDNQDGVYIIEVNLQNQKVAEDKARELLGKFYSYIGCVEGGIYNIFGIRMHKWIVKLINMALTRFLHFPINIDTGEWTMNCSETVTRILRAGGLLVCEGVDADEVTPMDLYRELTKNK